MKGIKGTYERETQYFYELITSPIEIEEKMVLTSGIKAYSKEYKEADLSRNTQIKVHISEGFSFIKDISPNRELVERLIGRLKALNACPIHLMDIVEDFLQGY